MDNKKLAAIALVSVAVLAWGAMALSSREPDPMTQFKPEQLKEFNDLEAEQRSIFKRAGGVWEKMSPEDKKTFMAKHWDREELARRTWGKYGAETEGKSVGQQMGEAAKAVSPPGSSGY